MFISITDGMSSSYVNLLNCLRLHFGGGWMDFNLATRIQRLSAKSVPRLTIAPVAHTFLTWPGTTRGATECDRLAQSV